MLALAVSLLFVSLGMWQQDRAAQKRAAYTEFELRGSAAPVDFNQIWVADGAAQEWFRAVLSGHYLGQTILLDNQLHQGRAGYLVYTVFEIEGRRQKILVNRGWIPAAADRSRAPQFATPITSQHLEGRLSQPPAAGLQLAGSSLIEPMAPGLWRVQNINYSALTATLGEELQSITLLLDPDADAGFVRAWTPPGSDESRHLAYSLQWFAMALTVVVISVVILLNSSKTGTA